MRCLLPLLVLVASCSSAPPAEAAAEQLEREFSLLSEAKAKPAEICAAARRTAVAWRQALDRERYEHWRLLRDIHCRRAAQQAELGT